MAVKCILTGQTPSVLDGVTENVQTQIDNKVDKVTGKGLSTEDYTTVEKTKLSGIEEGAQKNTVTSVAGKTGAVILAKADVGLGNVDNTSDANKPISTATQTALDAKQNKLSDDIVIDSKQVGLRNAHGYYPTSFLSIKGGENSFLSATYAAADDIYYGFSAPLAESPGDGQKPNEIYLAKAPYAGGDYSVDFTTPVSLKNVADPTDQTDAMNLRSTEQVVADKVAVKGILRGNGEGNVTAAEEAEVELVDLTIANVAGLQSALDANKGTAIAVTLASASWTGTAAPYTYTISNSAITATSNQELTPATDITADQLSALQGANIIDGGQAAGSMTLKAFGEKPSIDIPVRVIVKG